MNRELQDKAWAVLPKEFREEVKKQYDIATDSEQHYTLCTLEYLFGIHNLTSDIEPKTETNNKLMKARIKETGEIINIAEYDRVTLDKCDSYGNPIDVPYEDIELLQEKSENTDWEQMRHDMAKDFTATLLGRLNYDPFKANACCCCSDGEPVNPYSHIARMAVSVADAVIEELKNHKNQYKRES